MIADVVARRVGKGAIRMHMPPNANDAAPCPRVPVRFAAMFAAWARRCTVHLESMCTLIAPLPTLLLALGFGLAAITSALAQSKEDFLAGRSKACPTCPLAAAHLKRRDLTGVDLTGANLAGAVMHRARLLRAKLAGADLTGANLNKTDLKSAAFA